MSLLTMYDASTPPSNPPHTDVVAGYIGGNTPHVWTDAEWSSQKAKYRLPIYVRSVKDQTEALPVLGDANEDAIEAVNWMIAHHVPTGCTLALDLETRIDAVYVREFDRIVSMHGFKVLEYGSLSSISQDPITSAGRWVAHWTGASHQEPGAEATQYENLPGWDLSVISDTVKLWSVFQPVPGNTLPVLREGATGEAVRTVQALCTARHTVTPVTGHFDHVTLSAVETVQTRYGLVKDGIVGPNTWKALIYAS